MPLIYCTAVRDSQSDGSEHVPYTVYNLDFGLVWFRTGPVPATVTTLSQAARPPRFGLSCARSYRLYTVYRGGC